MQTQSEPRLRKRLHCTLNRDARRHNGLILNLSQRGLFVQTSMPAEPGTLLDINVHDPIRGAEIPIQAAVVWRRRVPARMKGTNESGMGLRLVSRPDAWQQMMSGMLEPIGDSSDRQGAPVDPSAGHGEQRVEEARTAADGFAARATGDAADAAAVRSVAAAEVEAPPVHTFVVRLAEPGGPRSRRLLIQAASDEAAREEALARAGSGWTILELGRR